MSDTKRQSILNRIKTILEGVSSIKKVDINKSSPVDIETTPFPCAFVYSGKDAKIIEGEYAVIGYENWDWLVNIEIWYGESDTQETLLGEVHTAMYADHSIGGYAVTSNRTGSEIYVLDPERAVNAMILDYQVIFRHKNGTP